MTTTTEPVAALYAARLRENFEHMMQARSSVATARWNNPSQMGHPCDRFLVLRRTKGAMQRPFPPSLQARFLMGTEIGKLAVRMIIEMGWDVKSIERPAEWEQYQISGRPDLEARPSGTGNGHAKYVPFEVKSVHPNLMRGVTTYQDIIHNKNWRVRNWVSQLMIYELLDGHEEGILLPIGLTGWWEPVAVPLDYDHAETLLKQCERVNAHIAAGTEPAPICDPDVCGSCSFFQTPACDIRLSLAEDISVETDEEAIGEVRRLLELKPLSSEYDAIRKRLGVRYEGKSNLLVPDVCIVSGKLQTRNVKEAPARVDEFWTLKYMPLAATGEDEE